MPAGVQMRTPAEGGPPRENRPRHAFPSRCRCRRSSNVLVLGFAPVNLRIATWNINSLRLRLPLLKELIAALDPDVICLQETKVPDELFPIEAPAQLGYPYALYRGMKGYNGVAILSRRPIIAHDVAPDWCS